MKKLIVITLSLFLMYSCGKKKEESPQVANPVVNGFSSVSVDDFRSALNTYKRQLSSIQRATLYKTNYKGLVKEYPGFKCEGVETVTRYVYYITRNNVAKFKQATRFKPYRENNPFECGDIGRSTETSWDEGSVGFDEFDIDDLIYDLEYEGIEKVEKGNFPWLYKVTLKKSAGAIYNTVINYNLKNHHSMMKVSGSYNSLNHYFESIRTTYKVSQPAFLDGEPSETVLDTLISDLLED